MKASIYDLLNFQGALYMEIKSISVGGFRNITKTRLDFETITALVGLNGYGKSNVMDAIDFGFDFMHGSSQQRSAMMGSKHCIPILKINAGQNYSFEIETQLTSKKQEYFVNYGFSFSWQTDSGEAKITEEYLTVKRNEKNQKFNFLIKRKNDDAQYRSSETGRCNKSIKIDSTNLVLTKIQAWDDLYYSDIVNQVCSIQYYIERHLDPSLSFVPAPFVIRGFQELELQGIHSIPRAIYFLKKDYNDKFDLLVNAFKQLFPDVKNISVQEIKLNRGSDVKTSDDAPLIFTDSVYSLSIIDDKLVQPVSFEHLSDGTKRIFLMLTFAVIADIKGLSMIAVEEPENSIHPGLFQNYLSILHQLTNHCKILITSHSPYIIQYLNPRSIYIGLSTNSGESNFGRIAPSKIKSLMNDAAEYDKSVGDYIFNLLSTPDADEYLEEYLENNGR